MTNMKYENKKSIKKITSKWICVLTFLNKINPFFKVSNHYDHDDPTDSRAISSPVTPFCALAIASSVAFLVAALISSCFFCASDLILLISLSAY